MNCENYQFLLSEFVDGTLTAEDGARVELHLTSCPDCADARNDLRVSQRITASRWHQRTYLVGRAKFVFSAPMITSVEQGRERRAS